MTHSGGERPSLGSETKLAHPFGILWLLLARPRWRASGYPRTRGLGCREVWRRTLPGLEERIEERFTNYRTAEERGYLRANISRAPDALEIESTERYSYWDDIPRSVRKEVASFAFDHGLEVRFRDRVVLERPTPPGGSLPRSWRFSAFLVFPGRTPL